MSEAPIPPPDDPFSAQQQAFKTQQQAAAEAPTEPAAVAPGDLSSLFSRLNRSALAALGAAESARKAVGESEIHMEHLLAALYITSGGPVRGAIEAAPLTETEFLDTLSSVVKVPVPPRTAYQIEIIHEIPPLSDHVRDALMLARRKADDLGSDPIRGRHLFYGAMSVEQCSPVMALERRGVDKEKALVPEPVPPATDPSGTFTTVASAQTDQPTTVDRLGYAVIVDALYALLAGKKTTFPLTIGISAPWGGGKSSVMRLLRNRLLQDADRSPWVIVEFPAWRYETGEQLWAAMAKATYDAAIASRSNALTRLWFRLGLEAGRGSFARSAAAIVAVLLAGAIGAFLAGPFLGTAAAAVGLGGLIAIVQAVWVSLSDPFKRAVESLAKKPITEGDGFSLAAANQVDSLMNFLLKGRGRVAIFIDDLDRCTPDNLVRVIEAVNQIFMSGSGVDVESRPQRAGRGPELAKPPQKEDEPRRLVFIMGMDRKVVAGGIEVRYAEVKRRLIEEHDPAGEAYGLAFLDKIIQLWVTLPTPNRPALRALLETVAGIDPALLQAERTTPPPPGDLSTQPQPGGGATGGAAGPVAVGAEVADLAVEPLPELPSVDSKEVWAAMQVGADCLEPNPRQIKRFNNAFRLQFHVVSRARPGTFSAEQLKDLARWIAIRLRWGALAHAMDEQGDLLWALEQTANDNGSLSKEDSDKIAAQRARTPRWFDQQSFGELPELMAILKTEGVGRMSELPFGKFLQIA